MELAARIGTMAANGGGIDYAAEIRKLWNNEVGATVDLTGLYDTEQYWSTAKQNSGQVFRNAKCEELIIPWCYANAAHMFANTPIKKITLSRVGNNGYLFYTNTPNLTDITYTYYETAAAALSASSSCWAAMAAAIPNCVVHCKDADIKYINGAWTVVQRDSANGGGYKCLTPRRSYRRSSRPSARFYARTSAWEVAA